MSSDAGTVSLVGAGPGDPDLLTVKARRRLDEADVVFHDALVTPALLETCPASTALVDVGKRPGPDGERPTQGEINRRLVRAARAGRDVVRLKGGDPYVFGRGGEEVEFLAAAGVDVEVVPGLTSAVAGPAVAGIPVTHREHASSLTVVTGHEDPTKDESALDWEALARTVSAGGTLVVLMGVGRLPANVATLREHGVAPDTPVAMVEKATWDDEYTVIGRLSTIVSRATDAGIEPPAVTVVGDVVSVRDRVIERAESAGSAEGADTQSRALVPDGGRR
ncbi:uroporphyrinogen-III C-methyltransferase [Halovivax limisalsi]|uniref:uroporphyrinogen-III C-methyltransferase n=1 Tax=Halovivax limisalsi TaxID=1453760 RepID=UPI001FFD770D|nr:uroporphyrinogen-III C-methyltransferase [Halovivax limisalsi]